MDDILAGNRGPRRRGLDICRFLVLKLNMTFKFITRAAPAAALLVLALAAPAHADRRAYGQTYEAVTASRGELDVEMWTTYANLGEVDGGPPSPGVREMIELEYGLTDRWDVALYNMLDITNGDTDSGYAGFKIETRFRPTFRGEWIVDPVFYAEFQQLFRGDADQKLELKLILAKDVGPLNVALNLAFEGEIAGGDFNPEFEWAFGASYGFGAAVKLGAEIFGKLERGEGDDGDVHRVWAGPALSFATAPGGALRGLWVTVAAGAGLTAGSDDFYGRAIVGLQF
jgi:hypothetical protein